MTADASPYREGLAEQHAALWLCLRVLVRGLR